MGEKKEEKAHYLVNNVTMLISQLANCTVVIKLAWEKLVEAYVGTV